MKGILILLVALLVALPPQTVFAVADTTPPTVTITAYPTIPSGTPGIIVSIRKGVMAGITFSGSANDIPLESGCLWWNTQLIDEYGEFNQDLGMALNGVVQVEAWVRGRGDKDGRTYTIRITARDLAGNEASTEAIVKVLKSPYPKGKLSSQQGKVKD